MYTLLLVAALLVPQQQADSVTIIGRLPIPSPTINVAPPNVDVTVAFPDSLRLTINENVARLLLRECGCASPPGTPWWVYTAGLGVATWFVWEFRQWARKSDDGELDLLSVDGEPEPPPTHHHRKHHHDG